MQKIKYRVRLRVHQKETYSEENTSTDQEKGLFHNFRLVNLNIMSGTWFGE